MPRYAQIERSLTDSARAIISDLQRSAISKEKAIGAFKDSLIDHETQAFVAGRRSRGDLRPDIAPAEERMLETRHERNMMFFHKFADDVVNGEGRMNYHKRAGLYGKSMWSIFTRGETSDWQDPADYSATYHWQTDPDVEHCFSLNPLTLGCYQRAQMSVEKNGFNWEEITQLGWPGESSPCQVHCHCHIRVVRHRNALPANLKGIPPADTPERGFKTIEELLGGPTMPTPLPAAGVPYVQISPDVINQSLRKSSNGAELGRMLPVLPSTLIKPDAISEKGSARVYTKDGLVAAIQRSLAGIWQLVFLMLLDHPEGAK